MADGTTNPAPYDYTQDPAFLSAPIDQQHSYLSQIDPKYAAADPSTQTNYLNHIRTTPFVAPPPPGTPPFPPRAKTASGGSQVPLPSQGDAAPPEGPIAQGLTTMETRLSEMPGAVARSLKEGYAHRNDPAGTQLANAAKSLDPRNLIDTSEGSLPMNIGGTAANLLPFAIDPMGGGIADSPIGAAARGVKNLATGTSLPARAVQTAAKTAENFDVTKPFKTIGEIGKNWRSTSQEGQLGAATEDAVKAGKASALPTKVPTDAEQAISEGRASAVPTKIKAAVASDPFADAISAGRASKIPTRIPKSAQAAPVDPEELAKQAVLNKTLKSTPGALANTPAPPQSATLGEIPPSTTVPGSELRFRPQAGTKAPKTTPGALGGIRPPADTAAAAANPVPSSSGVNLIPEPRELFAGEEPNYMANVPREELPGLAAVAKPGAGKQLQQLGKPVLYIPREALK